jgi:hypothetical protein
MSEDLTREEVHAAADRVAEDLLAEAGIDAPPVDVLGLAREHLGFEIVEEAAPSRRASRRAPGDVPRLALRPEQSVEERQWAAARAVAEHLKPELLRRLGFDPHQRRPLLGESLADLLAVRLLLPTSWFAGDARSAGYDVAELKEMYTTASLERIAWRLLDLDEPCIVTVVDNDHVARRRGNAYRPGKDLEGPERECQRYVHRYSRPHVVCADGWTVQGWPVHRVDGKREVLRSVVEVEGY